MAEYVGHDTVSNLAMYASNSEDPYITLQEDEVSLIQFWLCS